MPSPFARGLCRAALLIVSLVPAAHALDLERTLAEVASADPMLAARAHETAAARARARRAGAWDAPMLELEAVNVPVGGGFDMDPMTMRMVGVEQRVDVFGARGLARAAARHDADAAEQARDAMLHERWAQAWRAYASAYWAGERARAAADHRGVMTRMVGAAKARYEAGRGRLDDLLRAEAERARIVVDASRFAAEEAAARAELDALRGRTAGSAAESLAAPPERLAPESAPEWANAAAEHPRVRELAGREAARRGEAAAARRMVWPALTLRGGYGFRSALADGTPQDNMWSAGVGVMLPVFSGGREGAEAAEMTAMAEAMSAEKRAAMLDADAQIRSLRSLAAAAQRNAALLEDTVLVAERRALAAAWSAYETGGTDLSGVLEAAHATYAEELEAARVHEELGALLARLLAATARPSLFGLPADEPATGRRKP